MIGGFLHPVLAEHAVEHLIAVVDLTWSPLASWTHFFGFRFGGRMIIVGCQE
jgi:hypothetical protein